MIVYVFAAVLGLMGLMLSAFGIVFAAGFYFIDQDEKSTIRSLLAVIVGIIALSWFAVSYHSRQSYLEPVQLHKIESQDIFVTDDGRVYYAATKFAKGYDVDMDKKQYFFRIFPDQVCKGVRWPTGFGLGEIKEKGQE